MKQTQPRCFLELNSRALADNLRRVREMVPNSKVMAVIKANGYGHGMQLAAEALAAADEYAVTCMEDVERLKKWGMQKPVTLLSARFDAQDLGNFATQGIRPVVYDYEHLEAFAELKADANVNVWLKVDTGMGRLGFHADELFTVYRNLRSNQGVGSISLMTHLANADQPERKKNSEQFDAFQGILSRARELELEFEDISLLNSAGVVSFPEHGRDYVRPGMMLYGVSPTADQPSHQLGLTPVMNLKSTVISVRRMPAGSTIGYGSTYTLDADSRIAYVGCGYGDGYPRHAQNGTPVMVNGLIVPLVGRVSMDIIAVDVGELAICVGDTVELWGENNPVENVAAAAGTIAYELTCGVTSRVTRVIV